ncbi:MAG TPA: hypothetical protein VHO67_20555 [Polyangia bacterium]|nr:hypothetical protein [Polyangia bacterium]
MKTPSGDLRLALLASALALAACANRGMEAPTEPFLDGSGGAGGSPSGAAGAAAGGSVGAAGTVGTGGSGAGRGTGGTVGTGGASTGGVAGGTGGVVGSGGVGGVLGTGGVVATGGVVGSGGVLGTGGVMATGGVVGTGGTSTGGVAGGSAGQGGAAGLGQVIVSIDFVGGRPSASGSGGSGLMDSPSMAATEKAGLKPAANWNGASGITGTLANLHASDGSATAAAVTWSSPAVYGQPGEWTNGFTDAPGDVRMMNGYLDPVAPGSPATVKVSGLPAAIAASYDVYVYAHGDIPDSSTRTYQYAIGSTTVTVSQTGPSTPFPGLTPATSGGSGNVIVFRKVSGAAFTLTATPGTGAQSRAPVNGLQIVWPSGS